MEKDTSVTVTFNQIPGWIAPQPEIIDIGSNDITKTWAYTRDPSNPDQNNRTKVIVNIIKPSNGRWRFHEETAWRNSGDIAWVPNGEVRIIEFMPLAGWIEPPSRIIFAEGTDITENAEYQRIYYTVTVNTEPIAAPWRYSAPVTGEWINGTGPITVPYGSGLIVEFLDVPTWRTPDSQNVGPVYQDTTVTGNYTKYQSEIRVYANVQGFGWHLSTDPPDTKRDFYNSPYYSAADAFIGNAYEQYTVVFHDALPDLYGKLHYRTPPAVTFTAQVGYTEVHGDYGFDCVWIQDEYKQPPDPNLEGVTIYKEGWERTFTGSGIQWYKPSDNTYEFTQLWGVREVAIPFRSNDLWVMGEKNTCYSPKYLMKYGDTYEEINIGYFCSGLYHSTSTELVPMNKADVWWCHSDYRRSFNGGHSWETVTIRNTNEGSGTKFTDGYHLLSSYLSDQTTRRLIPDWICDSWVFPAEPEGGELPPEELHVLACRSLNPGVWTPLGQPLMLLQGASHEIEFSEVPGFIKPANVTVFAPFSYHTEEIGNTVEIIYETQEITIPAVYRKARNITLALAPDSTLAQEFAKWRLAGENTWHNFGTSSIVGHGADYTVEFNATGSWNLPAPIHATAGTDEIVHTVSFASAKPLLTVVMNPPEVLPADPRWSWGGYTWPSGHTVQLEPGSNYRVQAYACTGWKEPVPGIVTGTIGTENVTVEFNYVMNTYNVKVTLGPALAVAEGAQWRVAGETAWRNSGDTAPVQHMKPYTIEFKPLPDWDVPAPISEKYMYIDRNYTTSYNGHFHYLKVITNPPEAVAAGAQWRLVGETDWRWCNEYAQVLDNRTYEVEFKDTPGYAKPGNITGVLTDSNVTHTREYLYNCTRLAVQVAPLDAVFNGARWRLAGAADWNFTGEDTDIETGATYEIEFSEAYGWTKPLNITGTKLNTAEILTGTYESMNKQLCVVLSPEAAVTAGACWQLSGEVSWHASGTSVEVRSGTEYTIRFASVPGWTAPATIEGMIWDQDRTEFASYDLQGYTLSVFLSPTDLYYMASSRMTGEDQWQSGPWYRILPAGATYEIEFSAAPGYEKPDNISGTMAAETAEVTGIYTAMAAGWTLLTQEAAFGGRSGFALAQKDGRTYLIGGLHGTMETNDIWSTTDDLNWTMEIAAAGFPPRRNHQAVVFQNRIFLIGGQSGIAALTDIWSSADGISWQQEAANLDFIDRSGFGCTVFNNCIWLTGGRGRNGTGTGLAAWYSYDGVHWTESTWPDIPARADHQSIVFRNKMWLFGGSNDSGYVKEIWSLQTGSGWQKEADDCLFSARAGHTVAAYLNRLWLVGGIGISDSKEVWNDAWSTADGVNWEQSSINTGFGLRFGHGLVSQNNRLLLIGGQTFANGSLNSTAEIWYTEPAHYPLTVSIEPAAAAVSGAWRIAGESVWLESGTSIEWTDGDSYEVQYKAIPHWTAPANSTGTIASAEAAITGTYLPIETLIAVNLSPSEAVAAGAQWKLSTETEWRNSGTMASVQQASPYTILFRDDLPGWHSPVPVTGTAGSGIITVNAAYTPVSYELTVLLAPDEAVQKGGMWRLSTNGFWRASGSSALLQGGAAYTVLFQDLTGWNTPESISDIMPGSDLTLNRAYTGAIRTLTVNLAPAAATADGAAWRLNSDSLWRQSGQTCEVQDGTDYTVVFRPAASWQTPDDFTDTMNGDRTVGMTYAPALSGLTVNLTPAEPAANCLWMNTFDNIWRQSGTTAQIQQGKTVEVYFGEINTWHTPDPVALKIFEPETMDIEYLPVTHEVRVILFPEEPVANGAMWRLVGESGWREGTTCVSIQEGKTFEIEFRETLGFTKPDNFSGEMGVDNLEYFFEYSWKYWNRATESAAFGPRYGQTSTEFNGKIYLYGGSDDINLFNDVWSSADGADWTMETASALTLGRFGHSMAVYGNELWIAGGSYGAGTLNDVWHSADGSTWTCATLNAGFGPRYGQAMAVWDGKLWVFGGYDGAMTLYNDAWYSTDGTNWTQATGSLYAPARVGHTVTAGADGLYLIGGFNGMSVMSDVWKSYDGMNWTMLASEALFSARYCHQCVFFNDLLWVNGGFLDADRTQFDNDFYASQNGIDWAPFVDNTHVSARAFHSGAVHAGTVWQIGGVKEGHPANDVWYAVNPLEGNHQKN
ncbi:MAG: hypothetical protein PHQ23_07950 [Candidatus Wallbacteria bacterium]|nr:hypothetical protein [Candidatus Wallbacteria bacterium]